jgi:hypothetical protein
MQVLKRAESQMMLDVVAFQDEVRNKEVVGQMYDEWQEENENGGLVEGDQVGVVMAEGPVLVAGTSVVTFCSARIGKHPVRG